MDPARCPRDIQMWMTMIPPVQGVCVHALAWLAALEEKKSALSNEDQ